MLRPDLVAGLAGEMASEAPDPGEREDMPGRRHVLGLGARDEDRSVGLITTSVMSSDMSSGRSSRRSCAALLVATAAATRGRAVASIGR